MEPDWFCFDLAGVNIWGFFNGSCVMNMQPKLNSGGRMFQFTTNGR